MSLYTIIDADGEILSLLTALNDAIAARNTPSGCTAIPGHAQPDQYWQSGAWINRPAQPSAHHTWDRIAKVWADVRTMEQRKREKWAQIKASRAAMLDAPLATPFGVFDSDAAARTSITDAMLLAQTLAGLGTPAVTTFTLADNSSVDLDTAAMVTVGVLLGQKVQSANAISRALRVDIEAANSPQQLAAVTWPV